MLREHLQGQQFTLWPRFGWMYVLFRSWNWQSRATSPWLSYWPATPYPSASLWHLGDTFCSRLERPFAQWINVCQNGRSSLMQQIHYCIPHESEHEMRQLDDRSRAFMIPVLQNASQRSMGPYVYITTNELPTMTVLQSGTFSVIARYTPGFSP